MTRAPISLIIVSIAGLVYAGLDVLGTLANFLMYVWQVDLGRPDPGMAFLYHDRWAGIFTVGTTLLTVPLTIWLIAGCAGSLRLRPRAGTTMVRFAWTNLGISVVLGVLNATTILPRMVAQYAPGPGRTLALVENTVTSLLMLVPVGLSVWILLVCRRSNVRSAFAGTGPAAPGNFPVEPSRRDSQ